MKIGIVTVTFNSGQVLEDFFSSLRAQTWPDSLLYVIDNASSDNTCACVRSQLPQGGVLVENTGNIGFAAATNQGIRLALDDQCDAILALNNDVSFAPDLLEQLADGLSRHHCEMTAPMMYYHRPENRIWAAGGTLQPWLAFRSLHRGENETDHGQYAVPCRVTFAPLCCVLIRRSVFDRVGLLDERYFTYSEDVDFMYRCLQAGLALWYIPTARLWHKVNSLTGTASPFSLRYGARNRAYFIAKHCSGLTRRLFNILYPAYYRLRYWLGRDTRATWQIRKAAWAEGMRMLQDRSSRSPIG